MKKVIMKKILILGTSMLGPEVVDLIYDVGGYEVTGFVENFDQNKVGTYLGGLPIIWIDEAVRYLDSHYFICALGTTRRKSYIEQAKGFGFRFITIIHPSARISKTSNIGDGCIISVGVVVASNTKIGNHVFINRGCLIGHDTTIKDYTTLSPGANIAGAVSVEECVYIGIGAIVMDRMSIGQHTVIGAGSVVTRDVPDKVQVLGVPAKIVKTDIEGR